MYNIKLLFYQIPIIKNSAESFFYKWQTLFGAFIGAATPFLLWWVAERYQKKKKYVDELYFLEKILVDQINNVIEMKKNIIFFRDNQLNKLVENIKNNKSDKFSIDYTYFPLFYVSPLSSKIYNINTKSYYIENKLSKALQLSRDMPHIIKDLKRQLEDTIELNKDLALNKVNPPDVQKDNYIQNINNYKEILERQMLDVNIPIYLKLLIKTREAINELRRIGLKKWQIKFDPKYRFFINKKTYNEAREHSYDKMEKYFDDIANKIFKELENDQGKK